jgi:LysR family transcriptional activator of dmlA
MFAETQGPNLGIMCRKALIGTLRKSRFGSFMRKALDLNDIQIFASAARAGSLSEAAKELGLPTSTVSRSLTRLEKHLGLLLVRRGQRGLLLTDAGAEYLNSSVEALHTLRNAGELLDRNRSHPRGVLKVACPITMARDVLGPLMRRFVDAQPELRVDIRPYSSLWDREPKEDIDIFFKIQAPRDSLRRVHHYPSALRALYASKSYLRKYGVPNNPAELSNHRCTGSADDAFYANWKLTKGGKTVALDLNFQVMSSDPSVHRQLVLDGVGISILPLWMANDPAIAADLERVLPLWVPDPVSLCALYSGTSDTIPKVKIFLDFMVAHLGTDLDPRLHGLKAKECFAETVKQGAFINNADGSTLQDS